jgi:pimeloyl-ACP methyl ester carboxylesterase
MDYRLPLTTSSKLKSYDCFLFDLEGYGLSPISPTSKVSIVSLAADVEVLCSRSGLTNVTLVAHSLGWLVALKCAQDNPGLISRLILVGPPPNPLSEAGV